MKFFFGIALGIFFSSPSHGSVDINVMTYNAENLFDTDDDPDKADDTFLPLATKEARGSQHEKTCRKQTNVAPGAKEFPYFYYLCMHLDWSEDLLNHKLKNIAEVILSYESKNGPGADIVLLQEIENDNVLDLLHQKLEAANYQTAALIPSDDGRGITMAVLSRLPLASPPRMHKWAITRPDKSKKFAKRGFLEVVLDTGTEGQTITVLNTHLPANSHPTYERAQGIQQLSELAGELENPHNFVIAGGDLNVASGDQSKIFGDIASKYWEVSHHQKNCKEADKTSPCRGSSYYGPDKSWSFLDVLMVSKQSLAGGHGMYFIPNEAVRVMNGTSHQKTHGGLPLRFFTNIKHVNTKRQQVVFRDTDIGIGTSDHWPVTIRLKANLTTP